MYYLDSKYLFLTILPLSIYLHYVKANTQLREFHNLNDVIFYLGKKFLTV